MKKTLFWSLLALIVLGGWGLWQHRNHLIEKGIVLALEQHCGAQVIPGETSLNLSLSGSGSFILKGWQAFIKDFSIRWEEAAIQVQDGSASAVLNKVVVGNPPGFKGKHFLAFDQAVFQVQLALDDHSAVIEQLRLSNLNMLYEVLDQESNLKRIEASLLSATGSDSAETAPGSETSASKPNSKPLLSKLLKLDIENTQVGLAGSWLPPEGLQVELPTLSRHQNQEQAQSLTPIAHGLDLMKWVLAQAMTKHDLPMPEEAWRHIRSDFDESQDLIKDATELLKDPTQITPDKIDDLQERAKDIERSVRDLRDLFKRN